MKVSFTDAKLRDKIYCVLIQALIISFVILWIKVTNVTIILILLFWMTEPHLLRKITNAIKSKEFIAVISIFLAHLLSLIYTNDLYVGIKQIEIRTSLLIFPIIFGTINLSRASFIILLKTFIWACIFLSLVGLSYSTFLYYISNETVYLYSDNLLLLVKGQAIYFALYLNTALLFIFYLNVTNSLGTKKIVYLYVLVPFLFLMIFLLASRVSLVILTLLFISIVSFLIIRNKKYWLGLALIISFIVGCFFLGTIFPKTVNRFKSLSYFHFDYSDSTKVYHFNEKEFENRWNGLTIRLAIWSCTWDEILQKPVFGSGIGDYMNDLRNSYKKKGFKLGFMNDFSPHNQYLQIILSLGAFGLIVFLYSIFYPVWKAFRVQNYLYIFFSILILMNMFTEDIWGTFRGVVFFSFFNSLLLFQIKSNW